MKKLILCSILAAAVVVACSSSSDSTPGGTTPGIDAGSSGTDAATTGADASVGTDSSVADSGGGADAGTCGTGALGAGIPETAGAGTQPVAAGGALADGTYVLSKWEIYPPGSIDAFIRKETFVIAGGAVAIASSKDGAPETRASGTFTIVGSKLTIAVTCPGVLGAALDFTATPTELKIIENDGNTHEVHTYTKQ